MEIKTAALSVKAAGPDDGLAEGTFEGYASVFGNTDDYGDIVEPGAFTRTLGDWQEKGETIPVLWGHDMQDPFANIGGLVSAEQDDHGLKITGQLDLDNPTAAQVYRLMKGRRTNRMSFAYSVRDSERLDDGNHLKDLDLYEVSVVQVPANQLAEVLTVKAATSALAKAGRVLSAKNETSLREARDAIDSVLTALESSSDAEDGKSAPAGGTPDKASGQTDAKADTDEGQEAKSAPEPTPRVNPSVESWATYINLMELEGALP